MADLDKATLRRGATTCRYASDASPMCSSLAHTPSRRGAGRTEPVRAQLLTVTRLGSAGFSMVELLVTIIIAGVVFAAMGPMVVNALNRTDEDEVRVDGNTIAQDRIEQVRLLPYTDITEPNLNYSPSPTTSPSPFGDGRFGPTYTLFDEVRSYNIRYYVTPTPYPTSLQKLVKVTVSRPGSSYVTTAQTLVRDSRAGINIVTETEPTNLTLTVYFDNITYVVSPGVTLRRVQTNVTPNATVSPTPVSPPGAIPNATYTEVKFTGLTGGPNYTYSVFCKSSKATYTMAAPPFRLWTSGRLKFDTYPGGD
jgi:prepilin-type N-terminal cleavage/methylation domain-containing protein